MLKPPKNREAILLAVVVLLCLFSLAFLAALASKPVQPYETAAESYRERFALFNFTLGVWVSAAWGLIGRNIVEISAAITTAATVAIAYFTRTLWRATDRLWDAANIQAVHMDRTIKTMEDTAVWQLRAYISADAKNIEISKGSKTTYRAKVDIIVQNDGQTPAYDVTSIGAPWVGPYPLKGAPPEPTIKTAVPKSTLNPGAKFTTIIEIEFTLEDHAGIANGSRALYFYGVINYADVFKRAKDTPIRTTAYRFKFDAECLRVKRIARAEEGNDST